MAPAMARRISIPTPLKAPTRSSKVPSHHHRPPSLTPSRFKKQNGSGDDVFARLFAASLDPDSAPLSPEPRILKSRLVADETLYGLFLLRSSPTLAGYDYVVVDMEHGSGGIAEALPCLRALAAARTPAILRLPELSAACAKKALDLGPQGLMFPMIESPGAAELAVSFCRFPPHGVRGSTHTVVRASAYGIDDGYLARVDEELLVMCQVETAAGVAEIEVIAGVEGVDVVQMEPLDLSASMGYLWDPRNRKVRDAMKEAERKVLGKNPRNRKARP
ncbi:2-keto-3-deoxy-L-rhamnonate aldolase-like [Phoenix dactylifera]|uniref:2-keto-3-deoxy-L-rhamnonate aldolase-like n=1 Tax=Phoenix dactylifera TaxID=42345 RepID=A0A8B8ZW61_PHODC|nr:2-keto-3-deoxy-L-rhamnonate aldolase-like [Phoenix dactylifera]